MITFSSFLPFFDCRCASGTDSPPEPLPEEGRECPVPGGQPPLPLPPDPPGDPLALPLVVQALAILTDGLGDEDLPETDLALGFAVVNEHEVVAPAVPDADALPVVPEDGVPGTPVLGARGRFPPIVPPQLFS